MIPSSVNNEQLLAEVEDILRTMPSRELILQDADESAAWLGRCAAAIVRWDPSRTYMVDPAVEAIQSSDFSLSHGGLSKLIGLLHQARADLRMQTGQLSVVVPQGQVFDYFDEVRKVIEMAQSDVFFVDAYLDAEFVSRYLPHVSDGVQVRLLGGPKYKAILLPAVDAFIAQYKARIEVRSSDHLHDRYLFIDRTECYLSGASFKDGAKKAPVVLTRITDAFQAMWATYEGLWTKGKVER